MKYGRWRKLIGDTDRPDLLDAGKRLLGELAHRRKLGAPPTLVVQRTMADGSRVRARFDFNIPVIEVQAAPQGRRRASVDLAGFVTWPTDAAGATALPDSARVILAGDAFHAVREPEYSPLFPPPEGLNRAGNVDWHGKDGWIVSWYGPRTRYIDFDTPLRPWVFYKGRPLIDARDYIDSDAVVLGAAITVRGGQPWLLVVVEEYFFARWEKVFAVKLRDPDLPGAPATSEAARLEAIEGSYVYLNGRTHNDFNIGRHPWFFNPTGDEARLLTEDSLGYWERIIRVVEDPAEPGFAITRENLAVEQAQVTVSGGYTQGTFVQHFGQDTVLKNRIGTTDLRSLAPPAWPFGSPPAPVPFGPLDFTVDTDERARLCLPLLESWEKQATNEVEGELWQKIAVDYKADGSVVYGYGHIPISQGLDSGASSTDPGAATSNGVYGGGTTYSGEFTPYGAHTDWMITVFDIEKGYDSGSWTEAYDGSATYTSAGVAIGVRLGPVEEAIEVIAANENTRLCSASVSITSNGGAMSIAGDEVIGYSSSTSEVIADGMALGGFVEAGNFATGEMAATVISAQSYQVGTSDSLYLLHMDLRNDSLVVVRVREDMDITITQTVDHRLLSAPSVHREHTESRTTYDRRRTTYLTEGWINGRKVLEDAVVSRDTFDDPPAVTGFTNTNYPTALSLSSIIGYCLQALVSPSQSPPGGSSTWDLPALPASITYPRAISNSYIPYESASRSAGIPANNLAYQLTSIEYPTAQQYVMTWAIEVEAGVGEIVGVSYPYNATAIKVKWHIDQDGVPLLGAWCGYRGRFAYSMPLPQRNLETLPFRFQSRCSAGEIADRILTSADPPADHFSPIWVLAPTRGFLPPVESLAPFLPEDPAA